MKCPNCNVNLVMTERNSVEIDYCPDCRGVWLDRGELDKIIERSSQSNQNTASNETYRQPNNSQYNREQDYKRKKGGFLGDLFDF